MSDEENHAKGKGNQSIAHGAHDATSNAGSGDHTSARLEKPKTEKLNWLDARWRATELSCALMPDPGTASSTVVQAASEAQCSPATLHPRSRHSG